MRDWYKTGYGKNLQRKISAEKQNGCFVPGYLATPPDSPYGNVAFSIQLSDLLQSYVKARAETEHESMVCLKVGGTLRYRKEVCYVVIMCLENELTELPSLGGPEFPQFISNGFVNSKGMVTDPYKTPYFKASSIIKSDIAGDDPLKETSLCTTITAGRSWCLPYTSLPTSNTWSALEECIKQTTMHHSTNYCPMCANEY